MSFAVPSVGSAGGRSALRAFEFGRTYVVRPKGKHQATIVWLHGLGDNGSSWSQLLETLPLPNIKWICPTAPTRPISIFGGFPSTAWFDVGELSEDAPDDLEGLDASAAHVANLLSTEPADSRKMVEGASIGTLENALIASVLGNTVKVSVTVVDASLLIHDDFCQEGLVAVVFESAQVFSMVEVGIKEDQWNPVKLGVGGFSMGAATALYSGTCFTVGKYGNGSPYPANLSAAVGLSGWLPCAKSGLLVLLKTLSNKLQGVGEAAGRAQSFPVLLCHGKGDDVVSFKFGDKSSKCLSSTGFQDVTFKAYNGLGHYTIPGEMDEVCAWLRSKLGLEGTSA
ncbi:hypothetical protein TanjilG_16443 [Lupinus angustifolius]|uniref:Phospholipase/carboxylesterase/thioesterase domain-containing protein n=1 Tax=Lupinus angustifolius TaxID=3871 RepID=A0A1J7IJP6_LUPAN|nr:hypothetical protein TanjilG_16443 [Lupinus angustifolius]